MVVVLIEMLTVLQQLCIVLVTKALAPVFCIIKSINDVYWKSPNYQLNIYVPDCRMI